MNWYKALKSTQPGLHAVESVLHNVIHVADSPKPQRVILLPANSTLRAAAQTTRTFFKTLESSTAAAAIKAVGGDLPVKMKVLDSISDAGAKLVEMTADQIQNLRAVHPGVRMIPEVFYRPAVQFYQIENLIKAAATGVAAAKKVVVKITDPSGKPVPGANVVAFTNFATRAGAGGVTSKSGTVTLNLPASVTTLDRLYVYPESGFWGVLKMKLKLAATITLTLTPIDLSFKDSLRFFAGAGELTDGNGVKVGVVDTGIALKHPDLVVSGGECTVPGEKPGDFGPLGGDHGSHCAGIIAARGTPPAGIRGVAPGAALYSFRVFPKPTKADPEPGASNFAIAKAIDRAVAAGCDLLNLSLGGGAPDPATEAAIQDARNAGSVVIAATGNDDRSPVSFPASYDLCIAVSALGRKGLFPPDAVEIGDVAGPFGNDPANYIAAFSNVGLETDCTGPGCGVISTVPQKGYAVMDGTSMATPAVTGLAARMLARNPALLNATRDASRSDRIVKMVLQSCVDLGFPANLQGQGLPR